MNTQQPYYTIEIIRQQRLNKKEELLQSKERMQQLAHQLFAPQESKNKFEGMMQHRRIRRSNDRSENPEKNTLFLWRQQTKKEITPSEK